MVSGLPFGYDQPENRFTRFFRRTNIMKYCNYCHRITPGDPLFCNHCGRSYNVRLCGGKHVNPRSAEICSQCGSRELSTPQPRASLPARFLFFLLRFLPGLIVLAFTVLFFFLLLYAVFVNQAIQFGVMKLGLVIVLLWVLYLLLPRPVRNVVRRGVGRPRKDEHR